MKISKADALQWFRFFAELPEDEELTVRQREIVWATLRQLERAAEARWQKAAAEIQSLKSMRGRTFYVGEESKFPKGCLSCLFGSGLSAVRRTRTAKPQTRMNRHAAPPLPGGHVVDTPNALSEGAPFFAGPLFRAAVLPSGGTTMKCLSSVWITSIAALAVHSTIDLPFRSIANTLVWFVLLACLPGFMPSKESSK